jgi:hypothetical protein
MKTKYFKACFTWNVLGLGVGIKEHGGHYLYDNWAGHWKLTFHVIFLDIQFRLFMTSELKRIKGIE